MGKDTILASSEEIRQNHITAYNILDLGGSLDGYVIQIYGDAYPIESTAHLICGCIRLFSVVPTVRGQAFIMRYCRMHSSRKLAPLASYIDLTEPIPWMLVEDEVDNASS